MGTRKRPGIATILQHSGYEPKKHRGHPNPPLYFDTATLQEDFETAAINFQDADLGFTYFRKGHENAKILEESLKRLWGVEDALLFATGMAAVNCLMLELVGRGKHFVSQRAIYGGTLSLFLKDMVDAGRSVTFVQNQLDIEGWRKAIGADTEAIWVEMPSNPKVGLVDLEAIVKLAASHNIPVVVDSTFAPLLFRPLDWGATFEVRSGSKYENPGNTAMLGIVLGPHRFINSIRNGRYERYGAPAGALECWFAGLTYRLLFWDRMKRHSSSALAVATWLEAHRAVQRVHYPGLLSSPYYSLSQEYLPEGCGAILAVELKGDKAMCERFVHKLTAPADANFQHVINVGDTRSLVTYPAGTTHSKISPKEREAAGISETLIRFSIGLEDPEDLISDLARVFKKLR